MKRICRVAFARTEGEASEQKIRSDRILVEEGRDQQYLTRIEEVPGKAAPFEVVLYEK